MTIAFTCCGHAYRMPAEWGACPICQGPAKGRATEPLEPGEWAVREICSQYTDGFEEVIYTDAFMPVEWAEGIRSK